MRWYILRTLLHKEALRHIADRGGIFLALLLIGAALLLSLFGKDNGETASMIGGVKECWVDYWEPNSNWVEYLRQHKPTPTLPVRFRPESRFVVGRDGNIVYPQSVGSIQIRVNGKDKAGRPRYRIMVWYPGKDPGVMAAYLDWFWKESLHYFQSQGLPVEFETPDQQVIYPGKSALIQVKPASESSTGRSMQKLLYWFPGKDTDLAGLLKEKSARESSAPLPQPVEIEVSNEELHGRADERSMVATGLVIFALCFFSVYLLPALTCEERERGVLLAQVLSPASTGEILLAKFLFYPTMGMALGVALAAIYSPPVLTRPFFWMSLVTTAVGYLGVGLTIASIARTQRLASMGALCYMLSVALILFITQRFGIPSFQYLALEYYCPRIMHAALEGETAPYRFDLTAAIVLACGWTIWAAYLFRRRGWQ